jgi:hypothetical protein
MTMIQVKTRGITIQKSLHMKNAMVESIAYLAADKPKLIEHIIVNVDDFERRDDAGCGARLLTRVSPDSGRTWDIIAEGHDERREGNRFIRHRHPVYHLDAKRGVIIKFVSQFEWWVDQDDTDFGVTATDDYLPCRTNRIFYSISRDEGATWTPRKQLIQTGAEYDSVHWANGIWYERNGAVFDGLMYVVPLDNGDIILPVSATPLGEDGRMIKWPDRFGERKWPIEGSATIRGKWRDDGSDLDWEMSNIVITEEYMSRGLCEPCVAPIEGGRLLMVMRGSSSARQSLSGAKFIAVSHDQGRSWGPAVPMVYPDCSLVHSPGSLPNLFRSNKNGRLYMIANILPQPVRHCDPRYPLCIAEIDPQFMWVKPETITDIENIESRHTNMVRFSNWQRIEDRETGNPVIFMTEARVDDIIPGSPGEIVHDAYRYEIQLPEQ